MKSTNIHDFCMIIQGWGLRSRTTVFCKHYQKPRRNIRKNVTAWFCMSTYDFSWTDIFYGLSCNCTTGSVALRLLLLSFYLTQQPTVGQGLLIHEDSRSHTTTHRSR